MPTLWSAWLELVGLIDARDRSVFDQLRPHWMKNFYYGNFFLEIHQERECIQLNGALIRTFPNNVYLLN